MPVKLAVFDVDGTLLRGDTVCQVIARGLGKYERMCELERLSAIDDIIAAREEMAGWYRDAGMSKLSPLLDDLPWAPGVEEGIEALRAAGITVALASVTWSFAVERIARRFGIDLITASGLDFDTGHIDHVWGGTKARFLNSLGEQHGISMPMTAAVGDTSSDYDMLRLAGLGIFVGDSPPTVKGLSHMPDADIRHVAAAILDHQA